MERYTISPKQEILLKYIAIPIEMDRYPGIDPIRIMKGLFIFSQEVKKEWLKPNSLYEFMPYNYGPCSFEIYKDLRILKALGLLLSNQVKHQNWNYYSLSKKGEILNKQIKIDSRAEKFLKEIKNFATKIQFYLLLRAIYREYPDYATNSVFKHQ